MFKISARSRCTEQLIIDIALQIKIVYYLPSKLDVDAFQRALAKTLGIYWPASGCLVRDEHGWKVYMVPLTTHFPSSLKGTPLHLEI